MTRHLAKFGIACDTFDAYRHGLYERAQDLLHDDIFERELALIKAGAYRYLHFGIPCSTWSVMMRMKSQKKKSSLRRTMKSQLSQSPLSESDQELVFNT